MIESLQHVQYQSFLFIIETSSYKFGFYAQFESWDLVSTLLVQVSRVLLCIISFYCAILLFKLCVNNFENNPRH
jgi:hypothetical protein